MPGCWWVAAVLCQGGEDREPNDVEVVFGARICIWFVDVKPDDRQPIARAQLPRHIDGGVRWAFSKGVGESMGWVGGQHFSTDCDVPELAGTALSQLDLLSHGDRRSGPPIGCDCHTVKVRKRGIRCGDCMPDPLRIVVTNVARAMLASVVITCLQLLGPGLLGVRGESDGRSSAGPVCRARNEPSCRLDLSSRRLGPLGFFEARNGRCAELRECIGVVDGEPLVDRAGRPTTVRTSSLIQSASPSAVMQKAWAFISAIPSGTPARIIVSLSSSKLSSLAIRE